MLRTHQAVRPWLPRAPAQTPCVRTLTARTTRTQIFDLNISSAELTQLFDDLANDPPPQPIDPVLAFILQNFIAK